MSQITFLWYILEIVPLFMSRPVTQPTDTALSWPWLKSMSRALYDLDTIPLVAAPCPFPWQELADEIKRCFGFKEFSMTPHNPFFREQADLTIGIGAPHKVVQITSPSVEGKLTLLFSAQDIDAIMSMMLGIDSSAIISLPQEFPDNFFHFLTAETLFLLNQIGFDKTSFTLSENSGLPQEAELCQDIDMIVDQRRFVVRAILDRTFRETWNEYTTKAYTAPPTAEKMREIPVTLHIEAARAHLTLEEWMGIKPGDFLITDTSFYDPEAKDPSCMLTLHGKPLFKAALTDGHLKIIEIPSHHEVYDTMVDKRKIEEENPSHSMHDDTLSHEEAFHEEDEEEEEDLFKSDDDEDLDDDFDLQEETEEPHNEIHPEEKEVEQEEKEIHEDVPIVADKKPAAQKMPKKEASHKLKTPATTPSEKTGPLTLADIPVTVTVELAEITFTADKLLELQPGNVIDLETKGSMAHLTVNNKILGKGEIIKIGDTLGVRIVEIGL